jgi:SAM-dependent methyltransferase
MSEAPQREMALSFGNRAAIYDRIRPGYPPAAVDWAVSGVRIERALDLGAGTGLLTKVLLGRGFQVTALEPDEQMRAVLSAALPEIVAVDGYAEAIPADTGGLDAVFVGQAFHWFNRPAADLEIARTLRPGGIISILTNVNPPEANWEDVLHQRVLGLPQPSLALAPAPLAEAVYEPATETVIPNSQFLTQEEFLTLTSTWSWVATASAEAAQRVVAEAEDLARQLASGPANLIELPYQLRVVRAVRR